MGGPDLLVASLKFAHIAGVLVWMAGLFYLPAILLAHRAELTEGGLVRLRRSSRFAFTAIISPAAILAIGAGAALLLVADALHGWMFLKLLAVFALTIAHLQFGSLLRRHEARAFAPSSSFVYGLYGGAATAAGIVLWLVLAEPAVSYSWLPDWMLRPGGLSEVVDAPMPI